MKTNKTLFDLIVECIDTHTCGEPTRIILEPSFLNNNESMLAKQTYMAKHHDHVRKLLMQEPRGHKDMFGACLTKPHDNSCDYGALFFANTGYLPMCGHASIGIASLLLKLKKIPATPPITEINLDTVAGKVTLYVETTTENDVGNVTLKGATSFVYLQKQTLKLKENKDPITYDIGFGGNFAILINIDQFNRSLDNFSIDELQDLSLKISKKVNSHLDIIHPLNIGIQGAALIIFYSKKNGRYSTMQSITLFDHQVDRSPCGTGTSAMLALLVTNSLLKVNEKFTNESITKTKYTAWLEEGNAINHFKTYTPFIQAKASITGFNKLVLENDDPFQEGFLI